jgi:2-dehydro-3-deoxyglucarate aldolase
VTYPNPIRERLAADEPIVGAGTITLSPAMIEVYADLGFDFIWIDDEHIGPASTDTPYFETIRRAATAAGIEPMVRIESGEGHVIRKVLDAGIRTFVVPRVETAAEVREAVAAARFTHDGDPGERGVGDSLANAWGNRPSDYAEREDESVCVGIMLENRSALEHVDKIFSVPELGFARIGPADLSTSLGHPLEFDHDAVTDAIREFLAAGERHDVPVGLNPGFLGDAEATLAAGSQILILGSEVGAARTVLGERLADARTAVERA